VPALLVAASLLSQAPSLPKLPDIKRDPQVTYVDRSGAVLGVRGGRFAPPVDLARLPAYVPAAFVAIEDRRFYEHSGFDALGIARAIVADISKGRAAQGASTITQQLARNLFLTNDRNMQRKGLELLYAIQLEQTYSKKQILALYLSPALFQQAGRQSVGARGGDPGGDHEVPHSLRPRRAARQVGRTDPDRAGCHGRERRHPGV
jgi:penicillin-binding protein 1A